jgi:hypothetical protein
MEKLSGDGVRLDRINRLVMKGGGYVIFPKRLHLEV